MGSQPRRSPNYSDWHSVMKFNLVSLLFIKKSRSDAQWENYPYRYLNSQSLHGNFLACSGEHYHLKLFNTGSKTMPGYYRQDVAGPKCSSCQLEWYHKCKLSKSPVDTLRARLICLLMKKRPMPICTVHLFPRNHSQTVQKADTAIPIVIHRAGLLLYLAGGSRAVLVSQLLDSMALRVVSLVPSGSRSSCLSSHLER